ncbi:MAG: hypothetical protein JNM10_06340 [Planctomycetia bacterium]|nr:hypothetical protein [Planctomycetia bacterium]
MRTAAVVGWAAVPDRELLRAAAATFDAFVTVDREIASTRPVPERLAVVLLVSASNRIEDLEPLVPALRAALARPARGTVVVLRR